MDPLYYYVIALVVIWVVALLFKDKLKIDVEGPILMRKTKRLRNFIDRIAQMNPRFWRVFMNIGIPVSVISMGFIFIYLIYTLKTVTVAPQVSIVLPGVHIPGSPIYLPLWYGLIGLITVILVHEFGHGILARVDGVRIKSIGLALFAVLPAAFVEPDEEDIKKSQKTTKLRIYAAGSVFNLVFAGIALLIFYILALFIIPYALPANGLEILEVVPNSPADGILQQGMIIQDINGFAVRDTNSFSKALNNTRVGENLVIKTDKGTFTVKSGANPTDPSKPFIGIQSQEHRMINPIISQIFGNSLPWGLVYLAELFVWIVVLNFGIGLINLLPLKPLDGGMILEEILGYITTEHKTRIITYIFSIISFMLVAINIGYSLLSGFLK